MTRHAVVPVMLATNAALIARVDVQTCGGVSERCRIALLTSTRLHVRTSTRVLNDR
jgi:hypothetical protein